MELNIETLTLSDAAGYVEQRVGARPAYTTVHRWATQGYRGIRLDCRRVGLRHVTTRSAVDQFLDRCNEAQPPSRHATR